MRHVRRASAAGLDKVSCCAATDTANWIIEKRNGKMCRDTQSRVKPVAMHAFASNSCKPARTNIAALTFVRHAIVIAREADRRSFMIRTINCESHKNKREHASRMRRDNQREESKRAAFAVLYSRRCIDDRPGSIEKLKVRELADPSLKVQESQSGFPARQRIPRFLRSADFRVRERQRGYRHIGKPECSDREN